MEGSGEEVNSRIACHRILFVGTGAACCEMPCLSGPVTPRLLWLSIRESRAGQLSASLVLRQFPRFRPAAGGFPPSLGQAP